METRLNALPMFDLRFAFAPFVLLRGYGSTRFPSSEIMRNGQPSAVAVDTIALMDALKNEEADSGWLRLGRPHRQHHRTP